MNKIALYHSLPPLMQNIFCSLEGYRINRRRYNRDFQHILDGYNVRGSLSVEELLEFRDKQLLHFIQSAIKTVPFYKSVYSRFSVNEIADLKQLPILEKKKVQEHLPELTSPAVPPKECLTVHTSGTTGKGLVFPVTKTAERHQWAVWWRYRNSHRITFKTEAAVFTGQPVVPPLQTKPPYWRTNRANNELIFSGYHLTEKNIPYYLDIIKKKKIKWLHGYPSNLTLLAAYIIEHHYLFDHSFKMITTGAESLLIQQRKMIEQAFLCKVTNHYGMAEGVANISECPRGKLHIDEDYSFVELIPLQNDLYKIIGTNFTNEAFPLIRYDTGDIAVLSDKPQSCSCGNQGRIVDSIDGRIEEMIYLSDNSSVGRLDHLFKDMVHVKQAQLYQKIPGQMEIRIAATDMYSKTDEAKISQEIKTRMGNRIEYSFKYLTEIPKTARGKHRFVLSEIDPPVNLIKKKV